MSATLLPREHLFIKSSKLKITNIDGTTPTCRLEECPSTVSTEHKLQGRRLTTRCSLPALKYQRCRKCRQNEKKHQVCDSARKVWNVESRQSKVFSSIEGRHNWDTTLCSKANFSIMNMLRGVSVLAMVCMVSAAKLQGYSEGGDSGLGVDLSGGVHGGAAGGAGSGSVFPAVFVGSGDLPASAFGGVAGGLSGGAAGGHGGGALAEEYTGPVDSVAPVVAIEEEYSGPSVDGAGVAPVVAVEEEYSEPSFGPGSVAAVSPVVTVEEEYSGPSIDVTVEEEYSGPNEVAHVSPPVSEYISPNH
ncbi:uncharacterized protein LOC122267055 [Penaeus japonicus]|uniref:uncharacterized protein LOC122267055 n=1 Tax=Penaeus japonicus TaxID=27405 RepID=UPI001C7149A6|nr:uncharacterized protein LOC122267055 [Penaeus japonicus]